MVFNKIYALLEEKHHKTADMVEFDVQLTRDMTPVVYHDFALLYKGKMSTVNKHTLSQVQQIDDVEHASRATMTHSLNFKKTSNIKESGLLYFKCFILIAT